MGKTAANNNKELIKSLKLLVSKGTAHASLEDALANIPVAALGKVPKGLPYSIWQMAEHIRITQWDMLEFSKDANHKSPKWPDDYWPKEKAPADEKAWKQLYKADKKRPQNLYRAIGKRRC